MNKKNKIIIYTTVSFLVIGIGIVSGLIIAKVRKRNKAKNGSVKNGIKSILFVGDSTTFGNNSFADIVGKNYAYKKVAKEGISTGKMIPMLQSELEKNKYDLVVILGGYNNNYAYGNPDGSNIDYKFNQTVNELQKMYDIAKAKGSKVLAITPPASANHQYYNSNRQEFHNRLNKWILNSNADYKVDWYSVETGGSNNVKPLAKMTGSDGQHLSASAQNLLAQQIISKI